MPPAPEPLTAVRQVEQGLLDLDRQQTQLRLGARTLLLDVVMAAPERFTAVVRDALEQELPALRPATVRARFRLGELAGPAAAAGATAAYLLTQWLGRARGAVLVTLSRSTFFREQERRSAFEAALARMDPGREVVVLADADGLDAGTAGLVRGLLAARQDIAGVYSIGGGNRAVVTELEQAGVRPRTLLGHDLDADNLELLRDGTLSAVLHHDLRADMRRACQQVLRHHHLLPGAPTSVPAHVEVITPHNLPHRLGPR